LLDQLLHVVGELLAAADRQADGARAMRIGERVHVHPVRRHLFVLRLLLQILQHGRVLARARGPEGEEVVALVAHADAEAHGFERAGLAERVLERLQLGGRREPELRRVADAAQRFDRKRRDGCHGSRVLSRRSGGETGDPWVARILGPISADSILPLHDVARPEGAPSPMTTPASTTADPASVRGRTRSWSKRAPKPRATRGTMTAM